jgi:hypothetical protein
MFARVSQRNSVTEHLDGLLKDTVDLHVHALPDVVPRIVDAMELLAQAEKLGMKALVLKCHHMLTANLTWLIERVKPSQTRVFGALVLNSSCGGLNPAAVEVAIKLGAKIIWMPTQSAAHHIGGYGGDPSTGIRVVDARGNVLPEVKTIIEKIAEAGITLATGHISPEETVALVERAKDLRLRKILVTHAEHIVNIPVDLQKNLADEGAYIEHGWFSTTPNAGRFQVDSHEIHRQITEVGPRSCVLTSDGGQKGIPTPAEGFGIFINTMIDYGLTQDEIDTMTKRNPAALLGL